MKAIRFSFEWTTTEQSQSSRKVSGRVLNRNGEFATSLRVLAQAVDTGGRRGGSANRVRARRRERLRAVSV
jgi:hypothetical protein